MVFQARVLGESQERVASQQREEPDLSQDTFQGGDLRAETQMYINSFQAGQSWIWQRRIQGQTDERALGLRNVAGKKKKGWEQQNL